MDIFHESHVILQVSSCPSPPACQHSCSIPAPDMATESRPTLGLVLSHSNTWIRALALKPLYLCCHTSTLGQVLSHFNTLTFDVTVQHLDFNTWTCAVTIELVLSHSNSCAVR